MPFYINVPLSGRAIAEERGNIRTVDSLAQASELLYGDAAYIRGVAQERWPGLRWKVERVRAAKYVVTGEPKNEAVTQGGRP